MSDDAVLHSILDNARKELLDLTARNRLLNTSRSTANSSRLEIVDELSEQVFRRLVVDGKPMSFLPRPESEEDDSSEKSQESEYFADEDDAVVLFQPGDDGLDRGVLPRHSDDKLQTNIKTAHLQKKLLKLFYDSRTYQEEQGVNILYVALGFLKWYEDEKSDRERYAPLILIPVRLSRQSATSKFKVSYSEDELATNLSLQARIKDDFGIKLPDLPEMEELSPESYFAAVAKAVENQRRWEVLANDMVLWFFSFSKFLMYRDLQPENWPEGRGLESHPIIGALLRDAFTDDPPLCGDDDKVDNIIDPLNAIHVVDADSSQALAIEEVKRGRNLVIQGPPGTGKSQTIANLIAAAVADGKSVLFVAEKMAALEVVHRRLTNIGLGDMCLELHSNKANKKAVLQDLERTLALGKPNVEDVRSHCQELTACRDRLNRHLQTIHGPVTPSGFTPFQMVGELVRLRAAATRPPEFHLRDPHTWTRDELHTRLNLLRDLVDHVEDIGQPDQHPWRGSQLDVVLPMDVDRAMSKVRELIAQVERLADASQQLASHMHVAIPTTASEVSRVAQLAQHLARAPRMDRSSISNPPWSEQRQEVDNLVQTGRNCEACRKQMDGVVVDGGWTTELAPIRRDIAAYGRSWFRILYRAYRDAQATLRGILVDQPPASVDEQLSLVDTLIKGQKSRGIIASDAAQVFGRQAFGSLWNGESTDWASLGAISEWETNCRTANVNPAFRQVLSRLDHSTDLGPLLAQVGADLKPFINGLKELFRMVKLNLEVAFCTRDVIQVPLSDLLERLRQWQDAPEALSNWVSYSTRRRQLQSEGMAELVDELHCGATRADEAVARCEMAFYEAMIRGVFNANSDLASFNGSTHEKLLDKFRDLDRARIDIARQEVARAHYVRLPKSGSAVGEVGLVRREIQKKRRHLPLRKLLAQAGRAVQAIKPVFMMSPISVAQYLEPGTTDFDVLLIDEASQVQPVDALGAISRAKQIVVVGDSRQLPPTNFFSRMLGANDQEESEDDNVNAGDMESILRLCCAQNVPQRMLRWHYRSHHHSLIAVSNREFYENRLYVIPSPGEPIKGQGLHFHFVPDGLFDRGGTATNRVEAKAVANAVMEHARNTPDKSLGVGTFSVVQRDAILDELELLRRADSSLESFFVSQAAEPFFVKNLENIQGDERDVIFISIGYGKNAEGYMAMTFGPLSSDGGERRLNVLITRSRHCCAVFSSIKADDIDTSRARVPGSQALKTFLKYAELGILDTDTSQGQDYDSEFERQVAEALARTGWETRPQIGVAGFFIDLAVVDPDTPGRYLLGIECDGANYHRSRSARDRDRLRQSVLESRGWNIHRIWSTDWFHRPEEELKKVHASIEAARIKLAGRGQTGHEKPKQPPVDLVEIARNESEGDTCKEGIGVQVQPYKVASFQRQSYQDIHELPTSELASIVSKIIRIESPIHREEISRRVTQLWGLSRTGKRIRDAVEVAMALAAREHDILIDGDFYHTGRRDDVSIRDRSEVDCNTLRKPEMLPPIEIRKALAAIAHVNLGVGHDEAVTEAARLFGFKSTSARLRSVIEMELRVLLSNGDLEELNAKLYVRSGGRVNV